MRQVLVMATFVLVVVACSGDSTEQTTGITPATTLSAPVTTVDAPPGITTTTETSLSATTSTLLPVDGLSLADVVAFVEADLAARFGSRNSPPGVIGPELITCPEAETTSASGGDVFACSARLQTDDTINMAAIGVLLMVIDDSGTARWLIGEGVPANANELEELFAPHAGTHFCRELAQEGPYPFNAGYHGAMAYWLADGMPTRMDADLDGVPCETVFSHSEILDFWGGTDQELWLDDPRANFDFGFVTEVAADGSSLTIDFAEFLTGEEANEAAVAAGEIAAGEGVDNDYYIHNENPMLRTFPIAPDVDLQLVGYFLEGDTGQGLDGISLSRGDWATMFGAAQQCVVDDFDEGCAELGGEGWIWYGGGFLPYWILVEDGVIVAIDEQYLP